ncbi:MAG: hydrogenase maturation nickel metallochaperone HypA [Gammaproteobacteria bacterium]|nr:hydrogenase maturation nickel metallochaperone HypA [Gammaproteobacteria bacterium]
MVERAKPDTRHQFPCANCGALLNFRPGTEVLECPYCQHRTPIPRSDVEIREWDFQSALQRLAEARRAQPEEETIEAVRCDACGAQFEFEQDIHSGACPYCGHPVVLGTGDKKLFKPRGLLPFKVTESAAKEQFRRWLRGLWFAPGGLKEYARDDRRLNGIYLPFWTYDSDTTTDYEGERGIAYQEPRVFVTIRNGRRVTQQRMVTKIRWTPVRGVVSRFFDDVLVGASRSLPRQIADRLAPWDLDNLLAFKEDYLSGFGSQAYQVELDEGFERARSVMDRVIRSDIAKDIGGDAQRIHRFQTRHRATTFKHILLPIWSAGFRYKKRTYHFVVNARTGKVRGERPYSPWKIAIAVGIAILVLVAAVIAFQYYEIFDQSYLIETVPHFSEGMFR